jgi:response regulator RpfG family c-di-GMP phosphodiesterase
VVPEANSRQFAAEPPLKFSRRTADAILGPIVPRQGTWKQPERCLTTLHPIPIDTPPANSPLGTAQRVLIVDDDELVGTTLAALLEQEGYKVQTMVDPVAAIALIQREDFAVIISDLRMPRLSGTELLAQAREIQPDATRILVTGVLEVGTVVDSVNRGEIYRFLVKPWLREELLVTVRNAAQRHELIRQNAGLAAATLAMNERLKTLNNSLTEQVGRVAEQNQQLETLNHALRQSFDHSIELCLRTMQTFYPTLGSQARRVYQLCRAMGTLLKLPADQQQILDISAWLHDVGLLGVPRDLIRKWQRSPHALSEAERTLIEHHSVVGQELATFAGHLESVGAVIRAHHECHDGSGYPDRLVGEEIPWLARLLAVAVNYTASNHDSELAVEFIKQNSGRLFDPEAVRAFVRALPQAVVPRKERELMLGELRPGMVVATGISTASGILLIPEGQQLTATYIEKLQNHNRVTPLTQAFIVYC